MTILMEDPKCLTFGRGVYFGLILSFIKNHFGIQHACLSPVDFVTLSLHECRGIGGWLIYLGLSSFSSLNLYGKACGTISKGWLLKEERSILGTERKVLYSVIHKPSKIPAAWQEKMFLLLFYFFKHQSSDFYSGGLFQGSHCYFLEQSHCQWKSVICTGFLFL